MNSIRKNFTKSFYIYIYENEKGIPIYVGRGCGNRIKTHLTIALRRKKPHPFYFKLRKMLQNGIKPKYYKVFTKLSASEAIDKEIELIKKLGRRDLGLGPLLNLSDGGEGLINMSERHRNAIRLRHTGKINSATTRQKISASKKNNTVISKSHRNKISKTLKGRKCSQESIEKRKELRWINDGIQSFRIHKDDLQNYLNNGWTKGRHKYFSDDAIQKMKLSAKNRPSMSKATRDIIGEQSRKQRWINNGKVNKFIHFSKVQEYIEKGWVRGQCRRQS